MNGEMYQICCIAAAAKRSLKDKSALSYTPVKYENKIEFKFLPEKKLIGMRSHKAKDVTVWFESCLNRGLRDVKFMAPVSVNDRAILGFSNTTQSSLVCFYGEKITYFYPQWEFNSAKKAWNILYIEQEWKDAPSEKPHFENNSESFEAILAEIKEFACKINCNYFATVFQKAVDILSGSSDYIDTEYDRHLPEIPEDNLRLFKAASTADVFGGMGSWNDDPRGAARVKGRVKKYEYLSSELLKQIRLAALYAINEW